jgi:hypothetical protein
MRSTLLLLGCLISFGCGANRGLPQGTSDPNQAGSVGDELCASPLCAAHPCTSDCAFALPPPAGCPSAFPTKVSRAEVSACRGFCGLFSYVPSLSTSPGYCWHYDPSRPGDCQI